jgi:lysophospholipase L1-like esterase
MTDHKFRTFISDFFKTFVRLLRFVIIFLVLIIAAISAFVYFSVYLEPGDGPAGSAVPIEPFKQIWSQKQVLLLGIGDSVTAGFGAPEGYSYFDRLIKNPPDDSCDIMGRSLSVVFPELTAQNIAVSGSVSAQHLKKIHEFSRQPPDVLGVVVITTGGNDLIHNYGRSAPKECAMYGATLEIAQPWIRNYKERLERMIFGIAEKFPGGCHIFMANIYDPSDGTGNTNKWLTGLPYWPDGLRILAEYNKIIAQCAEDHENVYLVDIYSSFLGHGIHCRKFWQKHYHSGDPYYWYHMNIEDPNPRGYDAIRRLFLLKMIDVFADSNSV